MSRTPIHFTIFFGFLLWTLRHLMCCHTCSRRQVPFLLTTPSHYDTGPTKEIHGKYLSQGYYDMAWAGFEPTTLRSRVRCPDHSTTPPIMILNLDHYLIRTTIVYYRLCMRRKKFPPFVFLSGGWQRSKPLFTIQTLIMLS